MTDRPGILINLWHLAVLFLLDILFRVLNRTEVFGREYIPARGERNVLIVCNHISALDPLMVGVTAMPRLSPVRWHAAAKEELFVPAWLGWIPRSIGAFPVRRGEHDEPSMERMIHGLGSGVLLVFPEGTWSTTGELLPGRTGVGTVIYRARPAKIIPAAVKGTDQILPRDAYLPRMGRKARIVYGPPMDLSKFYERKGSLETYRGIVDAVMEEISRLHHGL